MCVPLVQVLPWALACLAIPLDLGLQDNLPDPVSLSFLYYP